MILELRAVSFGYSRRLILNHADLQIDQPGIYGLVAPNGSGKTTLFKLITGLLPLRAGQIQLGGHANDDQQIFEYVAYFPGVDALFPDLTGSDHLTFIQHTHHLRAADVQLVSQAMQIEPFVKQKVKTYSMGMAQRLLLAMSLLPRTPLLLLDEPLNGIDPTSLKLMRQVLQKLSQQGRTVIISSHNLLELQRLTSHFIFLENQQLSLRFIKDDQDLERTYTALFEQ